MHLTCKRCTRVTFFGTPFGIAKEMRHTSLAFWHLCVCVCQCARAWVHLLLFSTIVRTTSWQTHSKILMGKKSNKRLKPTSPIIITSNITIPVVMIAATTTTTICAVERRLCGYACSWVHINNCIILHIYIYIIYTRISICAPAMIYLWICGLIQGTPTALQYPEARRILKLPTVLEGDRIEKAHGNTERSMAIPGMSTGQVKRTTRSHEPQVCRNCFIKESTRRRNRL